jgi:hypothetical protein
MFGNAIATPPIKNQVIFIDHEVAGYVKVVLFDAVVNVEYLAAGTALEVIVIIQLGHFVSVRFTRQLDGQNVSFCYEISQCPVNGSNT